MFALEKDSPTRNSRNRKLVSLDTSGVWWTGGAIKIYDCYLSPIILPCYVVACSRDIGSTSIGRLNAFTSGKHANWIWQCHANPLAWWKRRRKSLPFYLETDDSWKYRDIHYNITKIKCLIIFAYLCCYNHRNTRVGELINNRVRNFI